MSIRKKALLLLVYPMEKGAAGSPAPSLGPARSSSSGCHDFKVLGCASGWWDAEDGQSLSTHGLGRAKRKARRNFCLGFSRGRKVR